MEFCSGLTVCWCFVVGFVVGKVDARGVHQCAV